MNEELRIALLIDAEGISPDLIGEILSLVCQLGNPVVRRAYGLPASFRRTDAWHQAQLQQGVEVRSLVGGAHGRDVADIAIGLDASACLSSGQCKAIFLVTNGKDFTVLAENVREAGGIFYGMGGPNVPAGFRTACTQYLPLPSGRRKKQSLPKPKNPVCPRCGGALTRGLLESRADCLRCPSCGGLSAKLSVLETVVSKESLEAILERARSTTARDCACPECGADMGLVRVSFGGDTVEIDVCGKCQTVWYDKDELSAIAQTDGVLSVAASAGKSFLQEIADVVAADIRSGRIVLSTVTRLTGLLKIAYHVPRKDIQSVIDALRDQHVIVLGKNGSVTCLCG